MKQKKIIQIWCLRTMLVFLLSTVVYPTVSAFEFVGNDSTHGWVMVELDGKWILQWRSLANIPIYILKSKMPMVMSVRRYLSELPDMIFMI